ncbi:sortase [Anaerosoma tenue]|uniref:sortase n=1 Tax=Anaerosoma tenue TaxID=2933588 RepID=UPI002260B7C4|nr:class E sortase [Anaerosoma tenue]MCK8115872.1 class E sortase [Anaerosoma tenue]
MRLRDRWIRATGNLLLGVALGLGSYYGLTTLVGSHAQEVLRDEAAAVAPYRAEAPDKVLEAPDGPALDFSGWHEEDEAHWRSLDAGAVFGRIVIPAIGLDTLVVNGVSTADLRKGPGWIDWTDLPGPEGTCGISGHRTTYGAPFARVDELVQGDTIDLYSPYRRYRYSVTGTVIVRPDQIEVVAPTEHPSLTLTACHPPYSARYRIAVQAELVEVRRVSGDAP